MKAVSCFVIRSKYRLSEKQNDQKLEVRWKKNYGRLISSSGIGPCTRLSKPRLRKSSSTSFRRSCHQWGKRKPSGGPWKTAKPYLAFSQGRSFTFEPTGSRFSDFLRPPTGLHTSGWHDQIPWVSFRLNRRTTAPCRGIDPLPPQP